ncbi:hypothetical protein ABKY54_004151 [Vibrio harveyi]
MSTAQTRNFHGYHEPSKLQEQKWLERIALFAREHGSFPLQNGGEFELHHVKGRTASHRKQHIGRLFVLPIEFDYHHVLSNNPLNVTHFKKKYEEVFGKQSSQFVHMCEIIREEDGELFISDEALEVIKEL